MTARAYKLFRLSTLRYGHINYTGDDVDGVIVGNTFIAFCAGAWAQRYRTGALQGMHYEIAGLKRLIGSTRRWITSEDVPALLEILTIEILAGDAPPMENIRSTSWRDY